MCRVLFSRDARDRRRRIVPRRIDDRRTIFDNGIWHCNTTELYGRWEGREGGGKQKPEKKKTIQNKFETYLGLGFHAHYWQ